MQKQESLVQDLANIGGELLAGSGFEDQIPESEFAPEEVTEAWPR